MTIAVTTGTHTYIKDIGSLDEAQIILQIFYQGQDQSNK